MNENSFWILFLFYLSFFASKNMFAYFFFIIFCFVWKNMFCYVEEKVRVCDWALAFSFITNICVYEFSLFLFFLEV